MYYYDGINLNVPSEVYPPAEDTYLLLNVLKPRGRVLEIGTGSGILAIAFAKKGHEVVATDINPKALQAARQNAKSNGVGGKVDVIRADLLRGIRGPFDTVIFNPPYLPSRPLGELRGLGELGFPGVLDKLATGPTYGQLGAMTPNSIPEDFEEPEAQNEQSEPEKDGPKNDDETAQDASDDTQGEDGPDDWLSRSWKGGKGGTEVLDRFTSDLNKCLSSGGRGYLVISSLTDFKLPKGSGLDFRVVAEQGLPYERLFVLEIFRRSDQRP